MTTPRQVPSYAQGLTLIELLTTVAIVAIVALIAAPNLQSFIQSNRQTVAINDLAGMISYARGEAIARNTGVALCIANADNTDCAASGDNWSGGYLVKVDTDTQILKIYDALPDSLIMLASDFTQTYKILFAGNGLVSSSGNFLFCDERGDSASRGVMLNAGGQIRFTAAADLKSCNENEEEQEN